MDILEYNKKKVSIEFIKGKIKKYSNDISLYEDSLAVAQAQLNLLEEEIKQFNPDVEFNYLDFPNTVEKLQGLFSAILNNQVTHLINGKPSGKSDWPNTYNKDVSVTIAEFLEYEKVTLVIKQSDFNDITITIEDYNLDRGDYESEDEIYGVIKVNQNDNVIYWKLDGYSSSYDKSRITTYTIVTPQKVEVIKYV